MKYCVILVLAVLLASCGLTKPEPEIGSPNRVVVQFLDQHTQEYYLLAVREQSLVVTKTDPCGKRLDSLTNKVEVVPFNRIEKVYRQSERSLVGTFIPSIVDCFQGSSAFRVNVYGYSLLPIFHAVQYTIGYFLSDQHDQFSLAKEHDVENLRTYIANYPDKEPEVLKRVK